MTLLLEKPRSAIALMLATIGVLLASAAHAQTSQSQTGRSPAPDPRTLGVVFADEPLRLDEVGLSMPLPEGTVVQAATAGSSAAAQIIGPDGDWVLGISIPRAIADGQSAGVFSDRIIEQVQQANAEVRIDGRGNEQLGPSRARLMERTADLLVSGYDADRFVFRLPNLRRETAELTRVYTVVHPGGRQFIVFELTCRPDNAAIARRITDTMIAATTIVDPVKLNLDRGKAVERGLLVLSQLTMAELDAIASTEGDGTTSTGGRWERLYRPGPTGDSTDDQELGYRRLQFRRGVRGELDRSKDPSRFSGIELEEGLLVWMEARLLQPNNAVIDTAAELFVSADGTRELWSVRMTPRAQGSESGTYVELGVRDGRELEITVQSPGATGRSIRPLIQGQGYLSQAHIALLGNLLVRAGLEGDFGFYGYRSSDQRIRFRRDKVERVPGPAELWRVSSTLADGMQPQVSLYDNEGRFIRTDLDNGTRWERTSVEELARLWRRKGLPLN